MECGICSIAKSTMTELFQSLIMAGCIAHVQNGHISSSGLNSDVIIVFLRFPLRRENFGNLAINNGYIAYFSLRMCETAIFRLSV